MAEGTLVITISNQVTAPVVVAGIFITGWHVPSYAECVALIVGIGGFANGGKCKTTGFTDWDSPNTGATNELLFNAKGGGYRDGLTGSFQGIKLSLNLQASDLSGGKARGLNLNNASSWLTGFTDANGVNSGYSLRLIKDDSVDPGTVLDYDGYLYETVKIGSQVWMKSNLRTTHWADGTPIPIVTDDAAWAALTTAGMCYYNNTP
jgi:hypothetical protein